MKNAILFVSLVAFFITACEKKEILPGKREDIFSSHEKNVSGALANIKVVPSAAGSIPSYTEAGGNKQHKHINYKMSENPKQIWKLKIGRGPIASDPIFVDGKIYAIDAMGILSCVLAKDGKLLWQKEIAKQPDEAVFSGGVTIDEGVLFVATNIGTVLAIDTKDQREIWKKDLKSPLKSAPIVSAGKLIITSIDNQTFALDAKSGNTIWTKTIDKEQTTMSEFGTPAVLGNDVICPYSSGDIVSLERETGSENWSDVLFSTNISASGFTISHISASPVIFDSYVLVSTSESKMVLIDAISGIRLWEQEIGTTHIPVVNSDWIFVLTSDNNVVCLSVQKGEVKWQTDIKSLFNDDRKTKGNWTGPLMINGNITVFGEYGDVLSFDISTGKLKNSRNIERVSFVRTPFIVDGIMYFISDRAELYAVG